jgi:hypothetical protein
MMIQVSLLSIVDTKAQACCHGLFEVGALVFSFLSLRHQGSQWQLTTKIGWKNNAGKCQDADIARAF